MKLVRKKLLKSNMKTKFIVFPISMNMQKAAASSNMKFQVGITTKRNPKTTTCADSSESCIEQTSYNYVL